MGRFIVMEGMDGSGKSTQTKRLTAYLEGKGLKVKSFHFPSGEGFYGNLVNSFLRGEFGQADDVDPYFAAFLFAGDRRDMSEKVNAWLKEYDVVLFDRYAFSNIAYQCAKVEGKERQEVLRKWIFHTEFDVFGIPKPDVSVFLGVPMSFVQSRLSAERTGSERDYLNGAEDIHENDISLQYRVNEQYHIMCSEIDDITMIDCADEQGNMLESDEIHGKIIKLLKESGIV